VTAHPTIGVRAKGSPIRFAETKGAVMRRHLKSLVLAGIVAITMVTGIAMSGGTAHAATIGACASGASNDNCNGAQVHVGDACWDSARVVPVAGTTVYYPDSGYSFKTELWYSKLCKSNFAVTTVITTGLLPYQVSDKIRRGPGPDGPYLMLHADWIQMYPWSTGAMVISPLVYSPDNPAQACVSTRSDDQALCTVYV
jgi:hypothetical protein